LQARQQRWPEAATAFAEADRLGYRPLRVQRARAWAELAAGERAAFRASLARLLKQQGDNLDRAEFSAVTWLACVVSDAVRLSPAFRGRARAEYNPRLRGPWLGGWQHALVELRGGDSQRALAVLRECHKGHADSDWQNLLLALAEARAGQRGRGPALLAAAGKLHQPGDWQQELAWSALWDETNRLLAVP
jgi:hypothetical protein